ncbi:hypothetical protein DASC09_051740 [Saccharomycopsis crataegensis]|uniref:Uncharacterized protein n=1 Tax=Saccharomycopsis crataegensis TaxID=43959 RepID=A0AAV5QSV7_9ASCO|nr:hypothetical protein DASC09_051740 [Saccharomycopsis crataegensis]
MSTPVDDARDDVEEDVEDDADHDSPVSSDSEAPPDPKIVTDTVDIDVFPGTVRNVPRQAVSRWQKLVDNFAPLLRSDRTETGLSSGTVFPELFDLYKSIVDKEKDSQAVVDAHLEQRAEDNRARKRRAPVPHDQMRYIEERLASQRGPRRRRGQNNTEGTPAQSSTAQSSTAQSGTTESSTAQSRTTPYRNRSSRSSSGSFSTRFSRLSSPGFSPRATETAADPFESQATSVLRNLNNFIQNSAEQIQNHREMVSVEELSRKVGILTVALGGTEKRLAKIEENTQEFKEKMNDLDDMKRKIDLIATLMANNLENS